MKRYIQSFRPFYLLVLAVVFALCFSFSDARARSPRAVVVSMFDNSVGGEPGEDPHLKVDDEIPRQPVWTSGDSGSNNESRRNGSNMSDLVQSVKRINTGEDSQVSFGWRTFLLLSLEIMTR